jgi:hypothetical protein
MEHGQSNEDPLLDKEDTHRDTPITSRLVTEGDDSRTLHRITGKPSLADWDDETVGDTHIGKRKHKTVTKQGKGKKQKRVLGSDDETPSPRQSPKYQKSNDSSSATDTEDGGMQEINTVLNHPVVVHSSRVSITNYLCYLSAPYFFKHDKCCTYCSRRGGLYSCHTGHRSWCTIVSEDHYDSIL